jgi:hypothetical protein
MALSKWEDFFKPETRRSGQTLYDKDAVFISNSSDTQVQAFVRTSTPARVSFTSPSISAETFYVDCNCKKDQLCKHIWACLIAVDEKCPDFLESKRSLERLERIAPAAGSAAPSQAKTEATAKAKERAQQFKEKQAEYRKLQYQLQKEKLKKTKLEKKHAPAPPAYPPDVEKALRFFSENGFDFNKTLDEDELSNARKKLSRIFHPDKGGSHEEALLLNENYMVLESFLLEQK